MHCTSCGKTTPANSRFCLHCGAPIDTTVPPDRSMAMVERDGIEVQQEEEKESFHWIMAIATVLCAVIGFIALGSESGGGILFGLVAVGLAIAGAFITELWTKVDRLPLGPKIIAWVPAIIGGSVVVIIMLILGIGGEAAKSTGRDMRRAELRSDIETAVRRGVKRK